ALTQRVHNLSARENAANVAKPALQHFDINPKRKHVQSAELDPLSPMGRSFGIQIIARETLQSHVMRSPYVIFSKDLLYQQISAHSEWRRAKHCDQFWITL